MPATDTSGPGLRRSLGVWPAVGLSVALMAPSMAANINPQGRDASSGRGVGQASAAGTPATAAVVVVGAMAVIVLVEAVLFDALPFDAFLWSGVIGTLILLVVYVLTTIGAVLLLFLQRKMAVPMWQVVIPIAALVVLVYSIYRNVIPYPTEGPPRWFPVVAGAWLLLGLLVVLTAPALARRVGERLTAAEGLSSADSSGTRA